VIDRIRLLLVEDDPDLAGLAGAILGMTSEVRVRLTAAEVAPDDVAWADVALVDFMLPGRNGCDLLHLVATANPTCRRILWTASSHPCPHAQVILRKPVDAVELEAAVIHGR
jgi:response regulator of citrate/malate metabolism